MQINMDLLVIYYHYWFKDGIIMNNPLDKILEDGHPDKPWFLNWVNENWTKRWDGGNNEILLGLDVIDEKCDKHFNDIVKYFKHHNYHKINNKPCLAIYRAEEIPLSYINRMIEISIQNGFDGITFIKTLNSKYPNDTHINQEVYYDFEFQFPPNYSGTLCNSIIDNTNFKFLIGDKSKSHNFDVPTHYRALIECKQKEKVELIRGIMPCWDNFPRHSKMKSTSSILVGSNSLLFYFTLLKNFIVLKRESKHKYFFINSLNEWGEQCVLEPSMENGYSYIQSYKFAKKSNLDKINEELLNKIIYFPN